MFGVSEEEDMNQGNDEKAKDQVATVVTLANDWFCNEISP